MNLTGARFFVLGVLLLSANFAWSDPLVSPLTQTTRVMGREMSFQEQAQSLPSGLGVLSQLQASFLGHSVNLVSASVEGASSSGTTPSSAAGIDLGRTDLYVGGTRIWAGDLRFVNGRLEYLGGAPFTQIPFPVFAYPLGPVLLEVDSGIEFDGALSATLAPGVSIPISDSSIDAALQAKLGAAAYLEGYASLYVVRAGVGGRVDIVEGSTGVGAHLYFNGQKPQADYLGKVTLLKGDLHGFVDTNVFFGRWRRILNKSFFSWPGKCFAFGAASCSTP